MENTEDWEWVTCSLNSGYQVSRHGEVRSIDRTIKKKPRANSSGYNHFFHGSLLKPYINMNGYLLIRIAGKMMSVHRLIALEFCEGHSPDKVVNHKNGIKTDNRAANLEWITQAENVIH